jgi:DNA mismatch endonuclease (patch repair protein)
MADTVTKQKRSEIMRAIKSKDTEMERLLRKELSKRGYRFGINVSKLAGKPDIVFKKKKVVIFLDSCFWHGCKRHCRMPKANRVYWRKKIGSNKKRDKKINKIYKKMGWEILRFWEHDLRKNQIKTLKRIETTLNNKKH